MVGTLQTPVPGAWSSARRPACGVCLVTANRRTADWVFVLGAVSQCVPFFGWGTGVWWTFDNVVILPDSDAGCWGLGSVQSASLSVKFPRFCERGSASLCVILGMVCQASGFWFLFSMCSFWGSL